MPSHCTCPVCPVPNDEDGHDEEAARLETERQIQQLKTSISSLANEIRTKYPPIQLASAYYMTDEVHKVDVTQYIKDAMATLNNTFLITVSNQSVGNVDPDPGKAKILVLKLTQLGKEFISITTKETKQIGLALYNTNTGDTTPYEWKDTDTLPTLTFKATRLQEILNNANQTFSTTTTTTAARALLTTTVDNTRNTVEQDVMPLLAPFLKMANKRYVLTGPPFGSLSTMCNTTPVVNNKLLRLTIARGNQTFDMLVDNNGNADTVVIAI